VRGCFVAARDHRLVIADYAQFELRVIADISGDETMTRAFQRGEDLHRADRIAPCFRYAP